MTKKRQWVGREEEEVWGWGREEDYNFFSKPMRLFFIYLPRKF